MGSLRGWKVDEVDGDGDEGLGWEEREWRVSMRRWKKVRV